MNIESATIISQLGGACENIINDLGLVRHCFLIVTLVSFTPYNWLVGLSLI